LANSIRFCWRSLFFAGSSENASSKSALGQRQIFCRYSDYGTEFATYFFRKKGILATATAITATAERQGNGGNQALFTTVLVV